MSGQHTPAPWLCPTHCPPDGFNIDVEGPLGRVVARCDVGKRHGQFRIHGEEAFANARLIAAAPELLDVARRLVKLVEGLNCTAPEPVVDGWMEDYRVARAAIAQSEATTHDD